MGSLEFHAFEERVLGEPHVYPGHPVTVAIMMMEAFPSYESANERPAEGGYSAASRCGLVCGAGGAIAASLDMLNRIREGVITAEQAIESLAPKLWVEVCGSSLSHRIVEGQRQADRFRDPFLEKVENWVRPTNAPAPSSMI